MNSKLIAAIIGALVTLLLVGSLILGIHWGKSIQSNRSEPERIELYQQVDSLKNIISNVEITYRDAVAKCQELDNQLKRSESNFKSIKYKYEQALKEIKAYSVSECQEELDRRFPKVEDGDTVVVTLTDEQAKQDILALVEGDCAKEQVDSLEIYMEIAKNSIQQRDSIIYSGIDAYNMQAQILDDANEQIQKNVEIQKQLQRNIRTSRAWAWGLGGALALTTLVTIFAKK